MTTATTCLICDTEISAAEKKAQEILSGMGNITAVIDICNGFHEKKITEYPYRKLGGDNPEKEFMKKKLAELEVRIMVLERTAGINLPPSANSIEDMIEITKKLMESKKHDIDYLCDTCHNERMNKIGGGESKRKTTNRYGHSKGCPCPLCDAGINKFKL